MTKQSKRPPTASGAQVDRAPEVALLAAIEALVITVHLEGAIRLLELIAARPADAGELAAQALTMPAAERERPEHAAAEPRTPGARRALSLLFGAPDDAGGRSVMTPGVRQVAERPSAYAGAKSAASGEPNLSERAATLAEESLRTWAHTGGNGDERASAALERLTAALNVPRIALIATLAAREERVEGKDHRG